MKPAPLHNPDFEAAAMPATGAKPVSVHEDAAPQRAELQQQASFASHAMPSGRQTAEESAIHRLGLHLDQKESFLLARSLENPLVPVSEEILSPETRLRLDWPLPLLQAAGARQARKESECQSFLRHAWLLQSGAAQLGIAYPVTERLLSCSMRQLKQERISCIKSSATRHASKEACRQRHRLAQRPRLGFRSAPGPQRSAWPA